MSRPKKSEVETIRSDKATRALDDLEYFIELIHPKRLLGNVHREVIRWWTRSDAHEHQLLLLPRDHMKSALIAYRVAWEITKNPAIRVLFISSTSQLATKQLKFIKDILTSDAYRMYWPDMINKEEGKREKWTEREISIDHPKRKEEYIRDPTVFTAGLTSNIVGLHCDIAVLDDVVVQGNAYTEDGREKVKNQYSLLSSIETVNAKEWVVGTRYHPNDLYSDLVNMELHEFDEYGSVVDKRPLFEVFERQVESSGDGTGEFLWPRQKRSDGVWFGFDAETLAKKRAQYVNKLYFRAQYYNDPHDADSSPIQRDLFQYYDRSYVYQRNGKWYFKDARLNVYAAVDFAFSLSRTSDYTAIVVVGVDVNHNYYVLDIDRFKTDKPSEYFTRILKSYDKWGFRKLRCEVTAAQIAIVKDLKENYVRRNGLSLIVDEFRPSRWQGSKEERIHSTLEPKYANRQIWHYPGGNCQVLEEELVVFNPAHDDVKDALAAAVDLAIAPTNLANLTKDVKNMFKFHGKFGGVT